MTIVSDNIEKKLDEIHKDLREGHASLHNRHDQADDSHKYQHHKLDRLRGAIHTGWTALIDLFKSLLTKGDGP